MSETKDGVTTVHHRCSLPSQSKCKVKNRRSGCRPDSTMKMLATEVLIFILGLLVKRAKRKRQKK